MKRIISGIFRIILLFTLIFLILALVGGIFVLATQNTSITPELITENALSVNLYNQQNIKISDENSFNRNNIKLDFLPIHTINSFISIEDKDFYSHYGISPKRMFKAFLVNVKSMSLKQGASTITQQLIKNTHLTNEKTFSRKINEILLSIKLEKIMTKEEILENYLNIIYFGNNCYGIENASQYYFSKNSKDLNIEESALLAGIIKSPNYYSPIKHPSECKKRRNLVLKEMNKENYITKNDYLTLSKKPLNLKISSEQKNKLNSYSQNALDEAINILKIPAKQIAIGQYGIHTYQDINKQSALENAVNKQDINCDCCALSINPKNGAIETFIGQSDYKILDYKRQPASTIKPLIVYAPAINENIISPATLINNEPITIGNYTPKNIGNVYSQHISVRDALSQSLNIPSVKIATYLNLNKIKHYAEQQNIILDENDQNYAIALGGFTYGCNMKELTGAYTSLANSGLFSQPTFIRYITNKDGNIIYKHKPKTTRVFRDDSAYLTTDILKTCAKTGTAKRLSDIPFEVASKTGTASNNKGNTDAYNISYTTKDIVGIWFGNMSYKPIEHAGGGLPTTVAKNYLLSIYNQQKPSNFIKPTSVEFVDIDENILNNDYKIVKANKNTPERFIKRELFSRFNMPKEEIYKVYIEPPVLNGKIELNKVILEFEASPLLNYEIYKEQNNQTKCVKKIEKAKGFYSFEDSYNKKDVKYYVKCYLKDKNSGYLTAAQSNEVKFINNSTITNTNQNKWYI